MQFKKFILIAAFTCSSFSAYADDSAEKLAKSLRLQETLASYKAQGEASNKKAIEKMLADLFHAFPNLNAEQRDALRNGANQMLSETINSWNTDTAAQIYTQAIAEKLNANEAKAIVDFYATPEGQKALNIAREAEQKMATYIISSQEKAMSVGNQKFIEMFKKTLPMK